jgi:hypothetical protein
VDACRSLVPADSAGRSLRLAVGSLACRQEFSVASSLVHLDVTGVV